MVEERRLLRCEEICNALGLNLQWHALLQDDLSAWKRQDSAILQNPDQEAEFHINIIWDVCIWRD